MPRILAAAPALPPHVARQSDIRQAVKNLYAGRFPDLENALRIFDHSRIECRQFVRPLDWYLRPRSFSECNEVYREEGLALLTRAGRLCLERAGLSPERVDHIIFVSSTGFSTPTLETLLMPRLGLSPRTSRLPIWGLGCAAGAAGLSRAFDYCRAHPGAVVLLTALECCSLTFMEEDRSKKNLVGTALFADGAAAVLVGGSGTDSGPRLAATRSHLFPDTERIMGWDFLDEGMQLVLSPRLPALVRDSLRGLVDDFLAGQGLRRADIVHYLTHPGGARVIDAYREALELTDELALTEELLARHGNLSSVSVLMVLEQWLAGDGPRRPGYGLLSAFGPGFSAEMVLLKVE